LLQQPQLRDGQLTICLLLQHPKSLWQRSTGANSLRKPHAQQRDCVHEDHLLHHGLPQQDLGLSHHWQFLYPERLEIFPHILRQSVEQSGLDNSERYHVPEDPWQQAEYVYTRDDYANLEIELQVDHLTDPSR
jgi:hypothetical protein